MGGCNSCARQMLPQHKLTLEAGLFEMTSPVLPLNVLHIQAFELFLKQNLKPEFQHLPMTFTPAITTFLLKRIAVGEYVKITGCVPDTWKLKIALLTDRGTMSTIIFVGKGITVAAVEKHITDCLKLSKEQVVLCYRNLRLNSEDFLMEYCCPPYSKLVAVCNSNLRSVRLSQYSYISPWKILVPGLNFEAICVNSHCCAYEQIVYIQRGRGTFHLEDEQYQAYSCPVCCEDVRITSFGVAWSRYTYRVTSGTVMVRSTSGAERTTHYCKLEDISVLRLNTADLEAIKL